MTEPKCETCRDTGFYGDNGPGKAGNHEWIPCDICNVGLGNWIDVAADRIWKRSGYFATGATSQILKEAYAPHAAKVQKLVDALELIVMTDDDSIRDPAGMRRVLAVAALAEWKGGD